MAGIFSSAFGSAAKVAFSFKDEEGRSKKSVTLEGGSQEELFVFRGHEDIEGEVTITPSGKKLEHIGIKIELLGQVELFYDRSSHYEFTSLVRELDSPGVLDRQKTFKFEFRNMEKQYDSYNGLNCRLRYFLRVTISKSYAMNTVKEQDFWVENTSPEPDINNSIKMEVGIEDCLHIEFEYNKSKYHLNDIVIGKIFFLLVKIKIKHMELAIIKRESAGGGSNVYNDSETLVKYEIMDGAPVRGESIPIRLFLQNYNLSPTYKSIQNLFNVKYYLNLVLVDEEDRRYFKQQEINIWRKEA